MTASQADLPVKNPERSVDELRARLRDLGYLDASVDRFVLGPVSASRSASGVALDASLRIGLLAGLLLGPSAAVAFGVRLPGLVLGPRDTVVLALYLGVVFGVVVAAVTFQLAWVGGVVLGRGRRAAAVASAAARLARGAGIAVGAACLAYLVLWWRSISPAGSPWMGAGWTLAALAGTAAVSLLLGRVVRLAVFAVIAVGVRGNVPQLSRRRRPWHGRVALGALAFGAAASLLFVSARLESPAPTADPGALEALPTGVRMTVVAVDGLDLAFCERIAATGRVPRLGRLLSGARARLTHPTTGADPARTWTTIATGQPPEIHGIHGLEARRLSGLEGALPVAPSSLAGALAAATDLLRLTRPVAASGLQRRSKSFWEVGAEAGLRTIVVNWWATWPAPDQAGVVVSDRATLRLDRGGSLDGEIAPARVYADLQADWLAVRRAARGRATAAFPGSAEPVLDTLRRSAEQDALQVALATHPAVGESDLLVVYLAGLDIAQHALVSGPSAAGLSPSAAAARVEALERYYEFFDELIGSLVEAPGRLVALLADPGRAVSQGPGLLALSGPMARSAVLTEASGADVLPTLLWALGVPGSAELSGRPLTGLFVDAFVSRVPVRQVASYGRRSLAPARTGATPLDREALDRLRSLGYVR